MKLTKFNVWNQTKPKINLWLKIIVSFLIIYSINKCIVNKYHAEIYNLNETVNKIIIPKGKKWKKKN